MRHPRHGPTHRARTPREARALRGRGYYVAAPPSIVGGREYAWTVEPNGALPELPGFLVPERGSGTGAGQQAAVEHVAPGSMYDHLPDLAVRCARAGMTEAVIARVLVVEFDAVRVPDASYGDRRRGRRDTRRIAEWRRTATSPSARVPIIDRGRADVRREVARGGWGAVMSTPVERLDFVELMTTDPPPVRWVVADLLARGHLSLLVGREKVGKSMLAFNLAAEVAAGGGRVAGIACYPGKVLLVDAENGRDELHRRLRRTRLDRSHADAFEVGIASGFDLAKQLDYLAALVSTLEPDLVVIDGFRGVWRGKEGEPEEVALPSIRCAISATPPGPRACSCTTRARPKAPRPTPIAAGPRSGRASSTSS